jgi:glycosyltransferase involved in cell wall biosynthesis
MSQQVASDGIHSPRVSAIVPFYNNEAFLAEAIDSVIAQTFTSWELLLVDDGSRNAATSIAEQYAARYPGKIRYFEHAGHVNRGISATRNVGLRHARGELIAFLDSDDIWLRSKLAEHVHLLDRYPEVGMVCGTTIEWRSWSNGVDRILPTGDRQDVVYYPPEAALDLYPLGPARAPSFSDVVFRADLVRRLGGFEEQFTGLYDDQVLNLKVYLSAPVFFSSTISNKYRQHAGSTCATAPKEAAIQAPLFFLEWLEGYLKKRGNVDRRVVSLLHRRLRRYRMPRIHNFLSRLRELGDRSNHLIMRVGRVPSKVRKVMRQR